MSKVYEKRTSVVTEFFYEFAVGEVHASAYLVVGDMKEFECFHDIVAEVPVELLLDGNNLFFRFFRKRIDKIASYNFASVSYQII